MNLDTVTTSEARYNSELPKVSFLDFFKISISSHFNEISILFSQDYRINEYESR